MKTLQLHLLRIFILLSGLNLLPTTAQAVQVQYQLTSQNSVANYVFRLFNNGNSANVQAFTVDFNPANFNETTLAATATPAGWVSTIFPSGPGFPATVDFYSTNGTPMAANQTIPGFAARVTQLGGFVPGTLPYTIYSTALATILGNGAMAPVGGGGVVVPVPVPIPIPTLHTWALLLTGLLLLLAVRRKQNVRI